MTGERFCPACGADVVGNDPHAPDCDRDCPRHPWLPFRRCLICNPDSVPIQSGDVLTSNGQDRATVTYVNAAQDYVELQYGDGHAFRSRLSDWQRPPVTKPIQ